MFAVSKMPVQHKERSLILPEEQYPVVLCLHASKMEAPDP